MFNFLEQIIGYEFEMSNSFNGEPCSWDDPRLQYQSFDEFEPYPDINSMTVKQLKSYARASGFTGYSALRKAELISLLSEF